METISHDEFNRLVTTIPQVLIGKSIAYRKGTAEIIDISLGGTNICLNMKWREGEPKIWHESGNIWISKAEIYDMLGDSVDNISIDSDNILTDAAKIRPLTVKSLISELDKDGELFSYMN